MLNLKIFKVLLISMIMILLLGFNFCYAVDLNSVDDLTSGFSSDEQTSNNSADDNAVTSNSTSSDNTNTSNNTSNTSDNNTATDNSANTTSNTSSNYNSTTSENTSTPSASVTNALPESDLGLTNILNILLIVIGTLIILLAIAILIRLKR